MAFALCHLLRPAKLNWSPETETCFFADLATWIAEHLRVESAVLDGEIACVDESGQPVYRDLLFRRRQCVFIAFDVLYWRFIHPSDFGADLFDGGMSARYCDSSSAAVFHDLTKAAG